MTGARARAGALGRAAARPHSGGAGARSSPVDRTLGNDGDTRAPRRRRAAREEPRRARERALVAAARGAGVPVWSEVELGYRLLPEPRFVGVTGTNGKTTTRELLGAIFRAAGATSVAGNVGRPLTARRRAPELDRLRALELPARGRPRARVPRGGAAQPRARPPRPPRHTSRPIETRSCGSSSGPDRRSSHAVSTRKRDLEFAASDELPAEPLIPGRHNRENAAAAIMAPARPASTRTRSPRACVPSRASSTGSSSSPSAAASATSTTPRRPTSPPRAARSPRTRRAGAADPRRLAQGRVVRAARARRSARTSASST